MESQTASPTYIWINLMKRTVGFFWPIPSDAFKKIGHRFNDDAPLMM
ncbi:MAG: hypothetical protein LBJ04_05830 [Sphingobacterium sp.]|nr:hypothetical protein [Sphingobacterium sp.]